MESPVRLRKEWKWTFILLGLCGLVTGIHGAVAQECYLSKGRCIYHLELSPHCHKGSPKDNKIEYLKDQKMNQIEQTMVDVHDNHARKIADLENRISQLYSKLGQETIRVSPPSGRNSPDIDNNNVEGGDETRLLDLLQKEFSGIRSELLKTGRRLRLTERHLSITRTKLNKTESALLSTTKKLLITEGKYHEMRSDRDTQLRKLRQRDRQLNSTKTQLLKTTNKLKKSEDNVRKLQGEKKSLEAELAETKALLETTQAELESSRTAGQEVTSQLAQITEELSNKETELNTCYSGKSL